MRAPRGRQIGRWGNKESLGTFLGVAKYIKNKIHGDKMKCVFWRGRWGSLGAALSTDWALFYMMLGDGGGFEKKWIENYVKKYRQVEKT